MSRMFKNVAKGGIATAAIGAMALTGALAGATPAQARDRDGISTGDVVAGALIIGGIAVLASAASKDRGDYGYRDAYGYRDSDYRNNRYGHGNSRAAIQRCVAAVERDARRAGYRSARVVDIRDVDRERRGWEVTGRLVVDGQRGYAYNDRNRYDDRRYDYGNGYGSRGRADSGSFSCEIERGRVVDIDYSGIRGLN
ncbi:MAG: hypothetical protein C0510_06080 [Erythrobacter sp.]|nr:hypothetical protein [Erythrobacter sp.]